MQITPAPPLPPASTAVTQPQTLPNALPQVLTQAVAPVSQKAVTPTPKSERSRKSHQKGKDEKEAASEGKEDRGNKVNISV